MAKNYYRTDLRIPDETQKKLKRLLEEAREKTNSRITMNRFLVEIIESYIADIPDPAIEEEK